MPIKILVYPDNGILRGRVRIRMMMHPHSKDSLSDPDIVST